MEVISKVLFKKYSPIKEATTVDKFIPYIDIAQLLFIRPILGGEFLSDLEAKVDAASKGGAALSPEYKALILAIAPALSFYAVYQGLPLHWAGIYNKGVTVNSSENSDPVKFEDLNGIRRFIRNDAQSLANQLIEYLCKCKDSYPLWQPSASCGCADDDSGTSKKSADFGINFVKRRRNGGY